MELAYRDDARGHALIRLVKGFLFIPVCIALMGALLAALALLVDDLGLLSAMFDSLSYSSIKVDGGRSVLSTIAGAMMSVISLVYSLTLVVFTLAAGNISPRLLETFSNNRTTQITIGLLGATFLYALLVLFMIEEAKEFRFSVFLAIVLAATSFFWLIYFVNDVAGRIRIDTETGRIQASLRTSIDTLLASEPQEHPRDRDAIPDLPGCEVHARRSGYVTFVDSARLIELAEEVDGFIEVLVSPGTFVIEGMPIALLLRDAGEQADGNQKNREREDGDPGDFDLKKINAAFHVGKARTPEGNIQFSVHLMVEIALRALSPGINDSYTAISAFDHLSASLARILQRGAPSSLLSGEDDTPRVWLNVLSVDDIVDAALGPMRQAARSNVLVQDHFIRAIEKMALVCRAEHLPLLKRQLLFIAWDANQVTRSKPDRKQIADLLWKVRETISKKSTRKRAP